MTLGPTGLLTNIVVPAWPSQAANLFWASPSGGAGIPSMRAIADADVPSTHAGSAHHAEAHGIAAHTAHATWKVLYTDGSGDEQELALGADGKVLVATGTAAAPTFEEIFTTHIAHFHPITAELASGALWPNRICVGESGEHGTFTAIRAKATAGTAGAGTNTILIEADDNPAFSSATVLFTLALNTSTEVDDTVLDNAWASGDIFLRARCSEVDATGPEEVVVEVFFKERAEAF